MDVSDMKVKDLIEITNKKYLIIDKRENIFVCIDIVSKETLYASLQSLEKAKAIVIKPIEQDYKLLLTAFEYHIARLSKTWNELKNNSPLVVIEKHEQAIHAITGEDLGWYCKLSPDNVCHYFTIDGRVQLIDGNLISAPYEHDEEEETYDACIYCGEPKERK